MTQAITSRMVGIIIYYLINAMASIERKQYLVDYYVRILNLVQNLKPKNWQISFIEINWAKIETWKIESVDKIIKQSLDNMTTQILAECEIEIIKSIN